jgi:cell division protein FtsI (penicillin-binding protein 3)
LRVAGYTINDYKPKNRWLSVPEIFIYSSNIGSAQMAAEVGTETQRAFFARLGMLRPASLELPELGAPRYPSHWRPINTMTIAYGHGMAVSPVHMVAGVSAMVNGGILRPLTLLRRAPGEVPSGERVVSAETSAEMRQLMRLVVEQGTGSKADVPGYLVGGKTGTADKLNGRGYSRNSRLASFVGAFPMTAPRYVILAMVDEPKPSKNSHGYATGGWVAAPAVGRVIQRIAPLLGIEPIQLHPSAPQNDLVVAVSATDGPHAAE